MNKAAKTIWVFGIYLLAEGIFLMLAPAWVLTEIGIPEAQSIWRLIVGFVVAALGYYYIRNAKENLSPFFRFTIQIRIVQLAFFLFLYFFERGTLPLVGFSLIEFLAGIWTWRALRQLRD
ncbi:MAG: hypothetical protein ABJG78_02775 [Cyclobacteriaceae bacterium]